MATVNSVEVGSRQTLLQEQHRSMGYALLWGAAMLLILFFWLRAKFDDLPAQLAWIALGLAGAALAVGLVRIARKQAPGADDEQRIHFFLKHRRLLALALIGAGLLLMALAFAIGLPHWPTRVGELLNIGVFGAWATWAGRCLLSVPGESTPSTIATPTPSFETWFNGVRRPFGLMLVVLGIAMIVAVFVMRNVSFGTTIDWTVTIAFGFLFLAGGSWALLSSDEHATVSNQRFFLFAIGGGVGLLLSIFGLWRGWTWFQSEFSGGIGGWESGDHHKLWLIIYLELAGLLIMYLSSLILIPDLRNSATVRRILLGYGAVLNGLLLLAFLTFLNIMVYVVAPFTFNWSANRGLHALSQSSKNVLAKLPEPVTAYVLLSPNSIVYTDARDLLENCKLYTNKLKVQYIVPERDLREYDALAQKYPELLPNLRTITQEDEIGRGILLAYGADQDGKGKHVLISPAKLAEGVRDPRTGKITNVVHKEEETIMSELLHFSQDQKKTSVYFLQGDGELDITQSRPERRIDLRTELSRFGAGVLVDRLRKDNFEVKGLSFDSPEDAKGGADMVYLSGKYEIPAAVDVLILAGPSRELSRETLSALDRYLERGGRMIVMFDVIPTRDLEGLVQTGLETLLKKYNVEVTNDYVFRRMMAQQDDPLVSFATTPEAGGSTSPLASQLAGELFPFRTARIIRPIQGQGNLRAETLLDVSPEKQTIWEESDLKVLPSPVRHSMTVPQEKRNRLSRKPLPVAVTVTEGQEKGRLIVFGDAEFAANMSMIREGDTFFNLISNSIDWLVERPTLGIRPRESGKYTLKREGAEGLNSSLFVSTLLMTVLLFSLGMGLWVVRRR